MLAKVRRLAARLRQEGAVATARVALDHAAYQLDQWRDGAFDRRFGTDTRQRISAPRLDGDVHARGGYGYQAVTVDRFRRLFDHVRVDPRGYDFVDVGAGKGRAMMLATDRPWRTIQGVELSAQLVEVARQNFARFRARTGQGAHLDLRHGDALHHELPARPTVAFLYNPFGAPVLDAFLDRLETHRGQHGHDLWLAYCNPVHVDRIHARPWLRPAQVHAHWAVYRAT